MGKRKNRIEAAPAPEQLERDVEHVRDNLTEVVSELDRRRHDMLNWRLQLRRHALSVSLVAGGIVLLSGGGIALAVRNRRRQRRPLAKARRLRQALARMIAQPGRVAKAEPSIGKKVLAAAASGFAGTLAKSLTQRATRQLRAAS